MVTAGVPARAFAALNPALTADELRSGCELARRYGVASVCILPHGGHATAVKVVEARQALAGCARSAAN